MAEKIKLTRPELKKQRDILSRYKRYLPTLKLKQQLLQAGVLSAGKRLNQANSAVAVRTEKISGYENILNDISGVSLGYLVTPAKVEKEWTNIAGVKIPRLQKVTFPKAVYSLFAIPPWVDLAIMDLQELAKLKERQALAAIEEQLLRKELTKIIQRINLFEKVMIPKAKDAIRKISIYLADEQTAGVARAKIAKAKQSEKAARQRLAESMEGGNP